MTATASQAGSQLWSAEEPLVGNYFVAVYPPFSAWQADQTASIEQALAREDATAPLGLYVHIPFCHKKCDYCYYLSYIGQNAATVNRYLDDIVRELSFYAERPGLRGRKLSFVYFGGGTPSTLTPGQLRRLTAGLQEALPWTEVKEFTFECAPRSVRPEFLEALRTAGVSRLSMGVQSFDDRLLKLNGRVHMSADVLRACELIRAAGFSHVNLDLMAGLIDESPDSWRHSIEQILALGPESVTIYQTEIPHNTRLFQEWKTGALPGAPVSWEEKRKRVDYAFGELHNAGYTIMSAYNAVRNPARHRFRYPDYLWRGADMLGLGVASFGYFGGVHFQNATSLEDYHARVQAGQLPLQRAFALSPREQLVREFVLQLKFGEIHVPYFTSKYREDVIRLFAQPLQYLASEGYLVYSNLAVRLKERGLLCVDRLLPHFYDSKFQTIRYT